MRKLLPVLLLAALIGAYMLRGPYFWPTSLAVGPCLMDFTSPNSYGSRSSPMRETRTVIGDTDVLVCYGSPEARGRTLFGRTDALVPWGGLWRMGANEPTRLFVSDDIRLGTLDLPAGRYSLYAVPDSAEWDIFVTRSTFHWGNQISNGVRDREIGSVKVPVVNLDTASESMTITAHREGLDIQWGSISVHLPISETSP